MKVTLMPKEVIKAKYKEVMAEYRCGKITKFDYLKFLDLNVLSLLQLTKEEIAEIQNGGRR